MSDDPKEIPELTEKAEGPTPQAHLTDPNGAASNAENASTGTQTVSAEPAASTAGALLSDASSADESLTLEQRVEKRFLEVEHFLLKLPHSIAHALHLGSGTPEEVAQRATAHLLDKNQ